MTFLKNSCKDDCADSFGLSLIALIKRFDGEFPEQYIKDCCEYMDISLQDYHDAIEKFRSPHLWEKTNGTWELKHPIWK